MSVRRKVGVVGTVGFLFVLSLPACSSSSELNAPETTEPTETTAAADSSDTTEAAPSTEAPTTTAGAVTTAAATTSTSELAATTTTRPTGAATLDAPPAVGAGEKFAVEWTGPSASGDYVTMVAAGATEWTNEQYFYATKGASPGSLVAPIEDGAYALWYVDGATEEILARRPVQVLPFEGALGAPAEVPAGTEFEVAWNGPDGPGDYVTIVAAGTAKWTNESYFYTNAGTPGTLVSPVEPGDYELWYVTGADDVTTARRPITVVESPVTLEAPDQVQRSKDFEVEWTGPDGPQDYITIVPADSPEGTYLDYAYTTEGNPVTLTAPDAPGKYEIWYASDRVAGTFASIDIIVT